MVQVKAVIFGAIGVIAETSDIQRRAYNQALQEAGLSWVWDREVYAELLEQSGGKDRLATLSAATGAGLTQVQIDAIHARKTELACAEIVASGVRPRPGVVELAQQAKKRGLKLGKLGPDHCQSARSHQVGTGWQRQFELGLEMFFIAFAAEGDAHPLNPAARAFWAATTVPKSRPFSVAGQFSRRQYEPACRVPRPRLPAQPFRRA